MGGHMRGCWASACAVWAPHAPAARASSQAAHMHEQGTAPMRAAPTPPRAHLRRSRGRPLAAPPAAARRCSCRARCCSCPHLGRMPAARPRGPPAQSAGPAPGRRRSSARQVRAPRGAQRGRRAATTGQARHPAAPGGTAGVPGACWAARCTQLTSPSRAALCCAADVAGAWRTRRSSLAGATVISW